jgi:hypothetical protein
MDMVYNYHVREYYGVNGILDINHFIDCGATYRNNKVYDALGTKFIQLKTNLEDDWGDSKVEAG